MKVPQFYVTLALGTLCLALSITSIVLGKTNNALQREQQAQQEEINRGNMSVQVGQNLLRDMAELSLKNEKIKQVLAKNGYTVNVAPAANSNTSPTPAK